MELPAIEDVLATMAVIIIVAKILEEIISSRGYAPVLGDILAGIILGPSILGIIRPEIIVSLEPIRWIGITSLLFIAGLETRFEEFKRQLIPSSIVAVGGIVASFALGYLVGYLLGYGFIENIFIGTILTATSVGLTVKTLTELGALGSKESTVILGAAVLDDIGGLIIMAISFSIAATGSINIVDIGRSASIAISFYIVTVWLLHRLSKKIWGVFTKVFRLEDTVYVMLFALMIIIAWASEEVNLSLVVGAYAVGLAFSEVEGISRVARRMSLLPNLFALIFFATSVAAIDITPYITNIQYYTVFATVIAAAFLGKILGCGIAARLAGFSTSSAIFIGIGMLPRAEVALIVSSIAHDRSYISDAVFSSVILLIYLSSIIAPLLLSSLWRRISR